MIVHIIGGPNDGDWFGVPDPSDGFLRIAMPYPPNAFVVLDRHATGPASMHVVCLEIQRGRCGRSFVVWPEDGGEQA